MFVATQPRRSLDSFSGPIPTPCPLSPNSFLCHTSKTPRGPWASSTFGLSNRRTFQRVSDLSPVFSHSWALFCAFLHSRKTQPFYFQAIPHSLHKTPGGGGRGRIVVCLLNQTRTAYCDRRSGSLVHGAQTTG